MYINSYIPSLRFAAKKRRRAAPVPNCPPLVMPDMPTISTRLDGPVSNKRVCLDLDKFVLSLLSVNQGLMIGETHFIPETYKTLTTLIPAFKAAGVKHWYAEAFYDRPEHQAILQRFYEYGDNVSDVRRILNERAQVNEKTDQNCLLALEAELQFFLACRANGIQIFGIEHPDIEQLKKEMQQRHERYYQIPSGLYDRYGGIAPTVRDRLKDIRDVHWSDTITQLRGTLKPGEKFIVHGGAGHIGKRAYDRFRKRVSAVHQIPAIDLQVIQPRIYRIPSKERGDFIVQVSALPEATD